jgi:hypothetical protein
MTAERRIVYFAICGMQSTSLRRRLLFHQLLPYGRENATGTFRKSLIALSLTGRTIVTRVNFVESERQAAISQWITDIVLNYKAKEC